MGAAPQTDPARMATVLYVLAETICGIWRSYAAVRAEAAAKLLDQLAVPRGGAPIFAALAARPPLPRRGIFPRSAEARKGGLPAPSRREKPRGEGG